MPMLRKIVKICGIILLVLAASSLIIGLLLISDGGLLFVIPGAVFLLLGRWMVGGKRKAKKRAKPAAPPPTAPIMPKPTAPAPKPAAPPAPKLEIKAEDLSFDTVLARYWCDDHYKSPSEYNFYDYHRAEFDCLLQNIKQVDIVLHDEKVLRGNAIESPFESTTTITKRNKIDRFKDFVVVDTETTGLKPGGNDIIEVSAVKFEDFVPVSMFTTLLKPRKPIPASATAVNGITDDMVENSPRFAQIKRSLEEYIGGLPVVAHNASFDIRFLHVSGLEFPEKTLFYDTLTLSRRHIRYYDGSKLDSYKLVDVCAKECIYFDGAHRACADALATGLLFLQIIRKAREVDSLADLKK